MRQCRALERKACSFKLTRGRAGRASAWRTNEPAGGQEVVGSERVRWRRRRRSSGETFFWPLKPCRRLGSQRWSARAARTWPWARSPERHATRRIANRKSPVGCRRSAQHKQHHHGVELTRLASAVSPSCAREPGARSLACSLALPARPLGIAPRKLSILRATLGQGHSPELPADGRGRANLMTARPPVGVLQQTNNRFTSTSCATFARSLARSG